MIRIMACLEPGLEVGGKRGKRAKKAVLPQGTGFQGSAQEDLSVPYGSSGSVNQLNDDSRSGSEPEGLPIERAVRRSRDPAVWRDPDQEPHRPGRGLGLALVVR